MRASLVALIVALLVLACGEDKKTYDVTFTCGTPGTPECPAGATCAPIPLGSPDGCDDLPGLFGNPPTKVEQGRPVGCRVGLSYGNPYYGDEQQTCNCSKLGRPRASWECPI